MFFDRRFFATADIPFLMIAGTGDAMIDLRVERGADPAEGARGAGSLSIDGASHAGFAAFADMFPLRLLANPDSIGC